MEAKRLDFGRMNECVQNTNDAQAAAWARQLSARVEEIVAENPGADRDNVRHTLILLEKPPLERLQRSLIRGRPAAVRRK
jgi:hypothetical protein